MLILQVRADCRDCLPFARRAVKMIFNSQKHKIGSARVNILQKEHTNGVNWLNSAQTWGPCKDAVRNVDRLEAIVSVI